MGTFANTLPPSATKDGTLYAQNVPLTSTEADINNAVPQSQGNPVAVRHCEALLAVVTFAITGPFGSNSAYVILQTSVDGGTAWVDVAGVLCTQTSGVQTYVIAAGVAGALAQQHTRQPGSAPAGNFANQMPLGGNIRFVGKSATTAGSSSSSASSGTISGVVVSVNFKLLGLR